MLGGRRGSMLGGRSYLLGQHPRRWSLESERRWVAAAAAAAHQKAHQEASSFFESLAQKGAEPVDIEDEDLTPSGDRAARSFVEEVHDDIEDEDLTPSGDRARSFMEEVHDNIQDEDLTPSGRARSFMEGEVHGYDIEDEDLTPSGDRRFIQI